MGDGCSGSRSDNFIGVCLDGRQQITLLFGPDQFQGQTNATETGAAGFEKEGRVTVSGQVLMGAFVGHAPDQGDFINNMRPGIDRAVDFAIR